jgi:hypothetical protein
VFQKLCSPEKSFQDFKSLNVESLLRDEVCGLFTKHKVGSDFAVEILHRHVNLPQDKRLVKVGRVITPWPTALISEIDPALGKVCPEAVYVHNGTYYPYEFVHVSKSEADAISASENDGFSRYSAFLREFAHLVEVKGVGHVLGLRLLSDEERKRAEDPGLYDYEITDGDRMITLSTDVDLDASDGMLAASWVFLDGVMRIARGCRTHIPRPVLGEV